jgi:CRISPR-associated endonuclease Csn1
MGYRLALDVGTASCGLIAWSLDEKRNPAVLSHYSLDIWSEPLQPAKSGGVGEPKKAARRAARMMRRGICRRARRLRKIAHLTGLLCLDRTTIPSDTGQRIHALRARAAEERIELAELLPVLLHLAKNRGPSGDWVYVQPESGDDSRMRDKRKTAEANTEVITQKPKEEKKDIAGGVRRLEALMAETASALEKSSLTLGQYLAVRRDKSEPVILGKPGVGLYPSRRMVEQEFGQIWDIQAGFHSAMQNGDIRRQFFDAIFFQRPLKSPAPMVGHCPLEPTLPRAPAAQMAAQAFRIEKQIADLRWGIGRNSMPLAEEEKTILRKLLNDPEQITEKGELSFKKILKAFETGGCPRPKGRGLNMDRASRDSLKGNTTLTTFRKLGLESEWNALEEKIQAQIINFLADLGSPDALDSNEWHSSFTTSQGTTREFSTSFVAFINSLRSHPKFSRLSSMGFDGGRMGYSIKALRKLAVLMQEGWDERAAVEQAYPDHHKEKPLSRELPLPEETGNAVVDVAMRQVYRAVDRAMKALGGPPTEIIVELSRDMALGVSKRSEIENRIKSNAKGRKEAAKAIAEHGLIATDRNIDRYLLWESQSHYCPYCASRIELGEALGSETEREHILPRTLTRVGGKRSQLVLAHRACNQQKGNRTPWQAFGADEERWQIIGERAVQLARNRQWSKARLLLLQDWEDEVLDDDAIAGFSDRQFHESSWIAKATAQWLRSVCSNVAVSRGELTAHLRRIWKLDTVIPEVRLESSLPILDREGEKISAEDFAKHKSWWDGHDQRGGGVPTDRKPDKRIDHRHHIVDALVISLTSRQLFSAMAQHYKAEREKERRGERARLRLHVEPLPALRELALNVVRTVEIRHKPDRHPDGALFEQTAYGVSRKPDAKSGEHLLAVSKPLTALIDKGYNVEKTRRALEGIEGDSTRETVLQAFDRRIASGIAVKQVFDTPVQHPQFNTPIRRVRITGNSVGTAAQIKHKNRNGEVLQKYYAHDGNAFLEIRVEDGKLIGKPRLVNVQDAMREKGSRPPHGVRRFWKGDTIELPDVSRHVIGELNSQDGGLLRIVPVTETCTFGELKKRGLKMKTVSGGTLAKLRIINV